MRLDQSGKTRRHRGKVTFNFVGTGAGGVIVSGQESLQTRANSLIASCTSPAKVSAPSFFFRPELRLATVL